MESPDKPYAPLLIDGYKNLLETYPIEIPEIKSGSTYFFETKSGLKYEVLFAKKKNNYLENIINFSVLNEEFDDEYSVTNRGEIYKVIMTVIEIILIYHLNHSYSTSYEFSGEFKPENENRATSIRSMLYYRKAKEIVHPSWKVELNGNKVIIHRKPLQHE